jgi:ATP-dependent helicase HrpB
MGDQPLPIDAHLAAISEALAGQVTLVLSAEPGAGKTTRVPLHLLDAEWCHGRKLLLLEPRRAAARLAATRMAQAMGQAVGGVVGYRTRHDSRTSADTRLEVVTEGVFNRLVLADPALEGYAGVLFDEVHERTLQGDTGLALALQSQSLLRPDLRLLLMSATLDISALQRFLPQARVIQVPVASPWPVTVTHRPPPAGDDGLAHLVSLVRDAVADSDAAVLVFLPGQREILAARDRLQALLPDVPIQPLYGALAAEQQQAALTVPQPPSARVILATNLAETSLTIADVETVIDSGLCRRPVFHPGSGLTRLETGRVSRQSATQRCGRAGRTGPGRCLRLWPASEVLAQAESAEITSADLSATVLDLAALGCRDSDELRWLTPPPQPAWRAAQALLRQFGALDDDCRITEHGRQLQRLPLAPRLGQLLLAGRRAGQGTLAAAMAAALDSSAGTQPLAPQVSDLLTGRDRRSPAASLFRRLCRDSPAAHEDALPGEVIPGWMLACAWPDRISRRRDGQLSYLLSSGRGARLPRGSALAGAELLVVHDLVDGKPEAQIRQAVAITRDDLEQALPVAIARTTEHYWDSDAGRVRARTVERLGALELSVREGVPVDPAAASGLLREQVLECWPDCLPWNARARQWQARVQRLHELAPAVWPDVGDEALRQSLDEWLLPWLEGHTGMTDVAALPLLDLLRSRLDYAQQQQLESLMPEQVEVPSGRRVPLDYTASGGPVLAVKLQEMFSCDGLPALAQGRIAVTVHLLSPAGRPLAVTADLASFWRNAWPDVRRQMRGRYPKHPWPEDPLSAEPTGKTRPRGKGGRQ